MSLGFVPRSVAKKKNTTETAFSHPQGRVPVACSSTRRSSVVSVMDSEPSISLHSKKKEEKFHGEELAILLECALSNYSLWLQPDLQRYAASTATEGYISLERVLTESYLIQQSHFSPEPPISLFPQILKEHGSGFLQLRMRLVTESRARSEHANVGGFDVQRTDWTTLRNLEDPFRARNTIWLRQEQDWEAQTLYVENIPSAVKTIPQILHFIESLRSDHGKDRNEGESARSTRFVDYVYLPSRHGAKDDEHPIFKGFAFVVFAEAANAETLAERWPWKVNEAEDLLLGENKDAIANARRSGFRSMPMGQWNQMKHIYLERQKGMLPKKPLPTERGSGPSGRQPEPLEVTASHETVSPAFRYPTRCLVFVKNLNPDTNKTVLRSLLASPFSAGPSGCIDYVDYTKGLDSCHVRLSSPTYANLLVDYLTNGRVVQVGGQDAKGREGEPQGYITAQVVTGRLEEIYWEKVPEKIRMDAIRRMHQQDAAAIGRGVPGPSDGKRNKRKKPS